MLIIEGFKEAIESKQFFIALKILSKYEYILEMNLIKISLVLVNSISEDPFFMEVKLKMIEKFVHLMDYKTIVTLLDNFRRLHKDRSIS